MIVLISPFGCISLVQMQMKICRNKKVLPVRTQEGIPTAAYQVLHMLPYHGGGPILAVGEGGVPTLAGGTYLGQGGTYPGWKDTYLDQGVPTSAGGYLPWLGYSPGCGQTENITSRLVLRTRSVMIKS